MNKNKIILLTILAILGLSSYSPASAAGLIPCGGPSDPCTLCHLIVMIKGVIEFGTGILIIVAIVGITISGVMYILAGGNPEMVARAKKFMQASIIGFAIFLGAWLMISIVMQLLSAKENLGIEQAQNWHTFECNTKSSMPTGAGG